MNVVKVVFFLVCLQATSLVARADCRALDSIDASKDKQNKKEITFLSNS